jgi:hypothetical protein
LRLDGFGHLRKRAILSAALRRLERLIGQARGAGSLLDVGGGLGSGLDAGGFERALG